MRSRRWRPSALGVLSLFLFLAFSTAAVLFDNDQNDDDSNGGLHFSIQEHTRWDRIQRRDGGVTTSVGLGDFRDVTYLINIRIGAKDTPLVLDTGSADVWVVSDTCGTTCTPGSGIGVPLYPQASFKPSGLDARLSYGDSQTGTHAFGLIGRDAMSLGGAGGDAGSLSFPEQYFAAINETTTTVLTTGAAGIFGMGFPLSSFIWYELYNKAITDSGVHPARKRDTKTNTYGSLPLNRIPALQAPSPSSLPSRFTRRQSPSPLSSTNAILTSFTETGPFMARLAMSGALAIPMFSFRLPRAAIDPSTASSPNSPPASGGGMSTFSSPASSTPSSITGDGVLSLGALPPGVTNDSMTWVGVRRYTPAQQGLPPPPDSPDEVYPMAWEVFIEDVFLDGVRLPRSVLNQTDFGYSALLDTGNSLLRGPPDVVSTIISRLATTFSSSPSTTSPSPPSSFPCNIPHTLAFQIGGTLFPIDPRDLIAPAAPNSTALCVANLVPTDTPIEGTEFLHSWSLGSPFLKSVVAAFHFGNITHPSQDAPRIGLRSTVPPDADERLREAVARATAAGAFPAATIPAPVGALGAATSTALDAPGVTATGTVPAPLVPSASAIPGVAQKNSARCRTLATQSYMATITVTTTFGLFGLGLWSLGF
ncbi:hypothetical protein HGRIS_014338 [Hohenbuehelia grisea]|uniref:Peptidase A1 domain-containing protein n=1 Tax=Hohenbuehelia grisea TaxID=104357 RepID=A0ABR3JTX9_9AGAR